MRPSRTGTDYLKRYLDYAARIDPDDAAATRRLVHDNCDDPDTILAALGIEEET